MTRDDAKLEPVRVWSAVLGSLVPWAALLVTIALAEDGVGVGDLAGAGPLYLGFVALPSALAIAAGRTHATRLAVTLVMAGVAVFAGVQVATIDDGQAGLAVLYVPMVAFPLAAVVSACEAALDRYRRTSATGGSPGGTSPTGSRRSP
ncbi:MAG TPA: hypothetical protein VNT52_05865 [Acidimicrobiales bacterium]|nr:hypothetical protein [Acidimicrobiales bacterium]